ncbi:MAG: mannose-1-phosphate guanylyltransferase/mannose-6-phosphate isomerase [Desulfarculales bacterium]|jgi:mannose-1-phosphate guanylyltransferase/mannose-6-phosphate isomerase|nr:mannose-1-phosphate guanylyltransferase/mannose-6-phosphate isomerase [Desulfarculales bacterium]
MNNLIPVILCGGSGSRLWPLSRSLYPKQFMAVGGFTLLGHTLERIKALPARGKAIVICNEEHRFYVATALQEAEVEARILLEPQGRNTAPAVALAACQALEDSPSSPPLLLVLPSDHMIEPVETLSAGLSRAGEAAGQGYLLTFGITPGHPATGYGYIQQGELLPGQAGNNVHRVERFIEKPDAAKAEDLIRQGGYLWNSGMLLTRADIYLQELARFAPNIAGAVNAAWRARLQDQDFVRPEAASFLKSPSSSFDYAILESTRKAAVLPLSLNWSDLGSWEALYQFLPKDEAGNVCAGDVLLQDAQGCYLHSSQRLLAAVGVRDLAVVETADAVLVAGRGEVERVKDIVEMLKAGKRDEFQLHPLVYRPWGSYERLVSGDRFQVKRIVVNPGGTLSLQKHHHRAEHWVVVGGTAEITLDEKTVLLSENQSAYVPLGVRHRLKNPGIIPLVIIEVQSGAYLGEDDITRYKDEYGR